MDGRQKKKTESENYDVAFQLQIEEAVQATRQIAEHHIEKQEVVVIDDDDQSHASKERKHGRASSTKMGLSASRAAATKRRRGSRAVIYVEDGELLAHEVEFSESCGICLDAVRSKQVHAISGCLHRFCYACLDKYVTQQAKDKNFPVPCPYPKCAGAISVSECAELLTSQEAMDILRRLEVENCIPEDEKLFCPHSSCSALMTRPRTLRKDDGEAECLVCHRMVCMRCKTPWHAGLSCKQFQKLPADSQSKEDQQLMILAHKKQWKQCGRCSRMIARNKGCKHMTCVCKYEFCYKCGREWTQCGGNDCQANRSAAAQEGGGG